MANPAKHTPSIFRTPVFAVALFCALTIIALPSVQAQTFTVLHNFTGGQDGSFPSSALTLDQAGNLYGTASLGGSTNCIDDQNIGCGTVFRLAHRGSGWVFTVLYTFAGGSDGQYPETPVVFGPGNLLYGTTREGGTGGCSGGGGCGTVFRLHPPPTFCKSVLCPWEKDELYQFTGGSDGGGPETASLTFDPAGNIYGTTQYAGPGSPTAAVYELSPSNGGWTISILYSFADENNSPATPLGGVVFDATGNLWGTTYFGGIDDCGDPQLPNTCGIVFELMPSASGWIENTVFQFHRSVGGNPAGNLIFDQPGNIYGAVGEDGPGGAGSIYQLTPTSGELTVLHAFPGEELSGPRDGVVMDSAGNLYGTTLSNGAHGFGSVFKLTPSNGGWIFTALHDFTGGSDGAYPYAKVILDSAGNLYGTTAGGGTDQNGVVFEITQ